MTGRLKALKRHYLFEMQAARRFTFNLVLKSLTSFLILRELRGEDATAVYGYVRTRTCPGFRVASHARVTARDSARLSPV